MVPGPVVYLTSGVLLVPTMEATLGGRSAAPSCGDVNATANATGLLDLGSGAVAMTGNATSGDDAGGVSHWPFWGACIYANAISYILKLVAHILQQKMIGEPLGSIVSVRAMVSPNSRIMKAIWPGRMSRKASMNRRTWRPRAADSAPWSRRSAPSAKLLLGNT